MHRDAEDIRGHGRDRVQVLDRVIQGLGLKLILA
jgi:hypothetical protein